MCQDLRLLMAVPNSIESASSEIMRYNKNSLAAFYSIVAQRDEDLKQILGKHGLPPLWIRPNTFSTLVLTILEQQVSLASAYAAFNKLKNTLKAITPENILSLTDEELRNCYFSRQKIVYVRELATAILSKQVSLKSFENKSDDQVRIELKKLKGIGDWTVDIYLLHGLKRTDVFPVGDLALVNALKEVKQLPDTATKNYMIEIAESWRPYRSMATMLLWHYYLGTRMRKIKLI